MTLENLFPPEFIQALLALLLAIVLDLTFGVAVAIKFKVFDLKKIADFYTTSVIPIVLGWAVTDIILRLAGTLEIPIVTIIGNLGIAGFYAIAGGALLASIVEKLAALRAPVPVTPPVVTVAVTLPTPSTPEATVEVVPPVKG